MTKFAPGEKAPGKAGAISSPNESSNLPRPASVIPIFCMKAWHLRVPRLQQPWIDCRPTCVLIAAGPEPARLDGRLSAHQRAMIALLCLFLSGVKRTVFAGVTAYRCGATATALSVGTDRHWTGVAPSPS
jgi:hypothetical protein